MKKNYIQLQLCLTRRVARMDALKEHCEREGATDILLDEFDSQRRCGRQLIEDVRKRPMDLRTRKRIEKFLMENEELLGAAVYELPHEYCDMLAIVELFEIERMLVSKILD